MVQELPYAYKVNDQTIFAFRPDLCFFVNGIYLGYSELKSNFMGQSAGKNGRSKVVKDYFDAVRAYHETFDRNARLSETERTQARRTCSRSSSAPSTSPPPTWARPTSSATWPTLSTRC